MFTLENWVGLPGILYGELAFLAVLVILPFVDRNPNRYWRRRAVAMTMAWVLVLVLVALTPLMAVSPARQHLEM